MGKVIDNIAYVDVDFHDLFRIGNYPTDVLKSFDETILFLEKNKDKVYYCHGIFDKVSEEIRKAQCLERLKEFWAKYPDGIIDFG